MSRHSSATILSIIAAALVVVAGIVISVYRADWSWFSRAGSLVVVIGILLTSSQVIEMSRRMRQRRQKWEQFPSVANRDWASDGGRLKKSRRHDEHSLENERSGLYMLIAGTLIWGFGDLAGSLFIL